MSTFQDYFYNVIYCIFLKVKTALVTAIFVFHTELDLLHVKQKFSMPNSVMELVFYVVLILTYLLLKLLNSKLLFRVSVFKIYQKNIFLFFLFIKNFIYHLNSSVFKSSSTNHSILCKNLQQKSTLL